MKRNMLPVLLASVCAAFLVNAAAPTTPRLPDGRPDLNGTWDNGGGIDFLQPQQKPDGSLCVSGCAAPAPAAAAAPSPPAARPPPDRPQYRPEFAARVEDLRKR